MAYRKIDMLAELKLMARGKDPTIPARDVARWAVEWVNAGLDGNRAGPGNGPKLEPPGGMTPWTSWTGSTAWRTHAARWR